MRNLLLFSVALGLIVSANVSAQITISNNFQPIPGTVLQFHQDTSADSALFARMTSGTGGPMVWDFSARVYGGEYDINVVDVGSTPNIDSFPNANLVLLVPIGADTTWSIQRSDANVFERQGAVTHAPTGEIIVVYRNITPDWLFPLAYSNQWISFRQWTQLNPPFRTEVLDSTYNTANAWGTIQYRANSDACLRVMSHEHLLFNTYDENNNLIYSFFSDTYTANFVAAGFATPVTVSKSVQSFSTTYASTASDEFVGGPSDISEKGNLPTQFNLAQNYPNPFNPSTTIQYDLPKSAFVKLEIFDVLGRRVDILADGRQEAGHHTATWNGGDKASGLYYYTIQAGDFSEAKKMLLLK